MKSNGGKKKDGKIADKVREVVAVAVVDVLVRDVCFTDRCLPATGDLSSTSSRMLFVSFTQAFG